MATILNYKWLVNDPAAVCAVQDVAAIGNLVLNGTYYDTATNTVDFVDNGFVRNVTITSVNDLSSASFIVNGVQNGLSISETIVGPNNDTVSGVNIYDYILSVTVTAPVMGVSVGMGSIGTFPLIVLTNGTSIAGSYYALSFNTQSSGGCTYTLYESLSDLTNISVPFLTLISNENFIQIGSPYVNITQILQMTDVCQNILVQVNPASGSSSTLQLQFFQF